MSGVQMAVFLYLLSLPVVAATAWWLKFRYSAALRVRFIPAVEYEAADSHSTSPFRRLRRRVLSLLTGSGLLYWSGLWIFAAWVITDAVGGPASFLSVLARVGPAP